ncbi:MAG: hypothetical protein LBJ47_04805 [Tannerella sp.]|jgi:hypothetical protein|nr:hypothetical protein [Tannerella sp.]
MKANLTALIPATGTVPDAETGGRKQIVNFTPLAGVIVACTNSLRTFEEVLKAKSIRKKAQAASEEYAKTGDTDGDPVELTDDEFEVLFMIASTRGTDEKLAVMEMLSDLNEGFDIVKYEAEFIEKSRAARR